MFIGIDIGGTFTDGVLVDGQKIIKSVKVETGVDLSISIHNALEEILIGVKPQEIDQVNLSTTLITNLILQGNLPETGLLLLPGPGANPHHLPFAAETRILQGSVDYRGRVIEPVDSSEIMEACSYFQQKQIGHMVVACKFSQRNPSLELEVVNFIRKHFPAFEVMASHRASGLLNWVCRANGAYYTLATGEACQDFQDKITSTLQQLKLDCPLSILKADGGTLPLDVSLRYPLETIFSGPAASTLGALATTGERITAVVMDIGGTTTDMALLLDGKPLLAERGTFIKGHPIPLRSLAVASLSIGGDSSLRIKDGAICLGKREGPALCAGGPRLTVTDALVHIGYSDFPSSEPIKKEMEMMAASLDTEPLDFCAQVLELFTDKLKTKLEEMFKIWEEEPAYRIWQVLSAQKKHPHKIICIGGPAAGIGQYRALKKNREVIVPPYHSTANAIGAAMARPTMKLDYFADTERKSYSTNIGGLQGALDRPPSNIMDARKIVQDLFDKTAKEWNLPESATEFTYEECFNIVRGWATTGKIFQIGLQTVPGIRGFVEEAVKSHE